MKPLARLADGDKDIAQAIVISGEDAPAQQEERLEEKISLNDQRMKKVVARLKACDARRVVDLGCGEGKLLKELLDDSYFEHIIGCDVCSQALKRAHDKLRLERLPFVQRKRISLM